MNLTQPLFDLYFLRFRIMLQAVDSPLLVFYISAQVCVFFLQHSDLSAFFMKRRETLRSSQHDGCVGGKSHQGSKGCDGAENG